MEKIKLIRIANIPGTINVFCKGLLKKLSTEYEVIAVASPGPEMKIIEEREGVRTVSIPVERQISLLKDIVSLYRIFLFLYKEKPTIIHGVVGGKASLLAMIAGYFLNVPIRIYTFTGVSAVYKKGFLGIVLRTMNRIACICATHVIPEGYGVKNDLEKFHITTKPLKVLGNGNIRGIDSAYYKRTEDVLNAASIIREKVGGEFIFCFVGRIVKDKGINELISAFKKLNKEFPSCRLILVGGYDYGLNPISESSKEEIDNNPSIYSAGAQKDVRPWLAASNCFVLPSYREGVPNAVLEAGAMSLPCIVTDINGSREIIIDGENGLIVPAKDSGSLYKAMCTIVTNPQDVEKMAQNSRDLVISRYEQNFVHQCLMDYYKKIIDETNILK